MLYIDWPAHNKPSIPSASRLVRIITAFQEIRFKRPLADFDKEGHPE
jgi:hypothetical protein